MSSVSPIRGDPFQNPGFRVTSGEYNLHICSPLDTPQGLGRGYLVSGGASHRFDITSHLGPTGHAMTVRDSLQVRRERIVTTVYTIGHSTHTVERLIALVRQHGVTAVADVRSQPYSRLHPQFNREELCAALKAVGISYVFLGKELGGRASDPSCYADGQVRYDRVAKSPAFEAGIERLQRGGDSYRVALLCAEKDPLNCHRTLLVARQLSKRGVAVQHILNTGALESQDEAEAHLLREMGLEAGDIFRSRDDLIEDAYRLRASAVAFRKEEPTSAPARGKR